MYEDVSRLARAQGVSVSRKVVDLVREALEVVEDANVDAIVVSRARNCAPSIGHWELKRRLKLR